MIKIEKRIHQSIFDCIFIVVLVITFLYMIEYPILHNETFTRMLWMPAVALLAVAFTLTKIKTALDTRWFLATLVVILLVVGGIVVGDCFYSMQHWFSGISFLLMLGLICICSRYATTKLVFDSIYIFAVAFTFLFIAYCFSPIAHLQYLDGIQRVSEYFVFNMDNPNTAGMYLYGVMCIIIINYPVRKLKIVNFALICCLLYMIIRTNSRACIISSVVIIISSLIKRRQKIKKSLIFVAWAIPFLFIFFYLFLFELGYENFVILGKSLFSGRQDVFKTYLGYIDSPLKFLFGNMEKACFQNAHNAPLSILSSIGVVGLIISEIMILLNIFKINKGTRISYLSSMSVIGLLIHSCAEAGMFIGGFPGIVFLLILFLLANYNEYETDLNEKKALSEDKKI